MRWPLSRPLIALVLAPALAADAQEDDGTEAWKALQTDYRKASQEYYAARRDAKTDEERSELAQQHPNNTFLPRYREHAKKYANKPVAVPALVAVLSRTRDKDEKIVMVDTLLRAHLESEAIGQAAFPLKYLGAEGQPALREIVAKSPHHDVQGRMLFVLGQSVKANDPDEAKRIFLRVKKEYARVVFYGTKTFGAAAASEIYELEMLQVGMAAPEI